MEQLFSFLMEMDKLKQVNRRSYVAVKNAEGVNRRENSAEHSWHLAIALLSLQQRFDPALDLHKTLKMALVHDICEIGPGDISVFDAQRQHKTVQERAYLQQLARHSPSFAQEVGLLWEEYEAQQTLESHWVKIVDRLLPFMMNLNTAGLAWQEQGICRSQVVAINRTTAELAPDIYSWMLEKMDHAVTQGWLREG